MLKKSYAKTGKSCRVTFRLPASSAGKTAVLCGEFNDWDQKAQTMKRLKDGSFSTTVSLSPGSSYRFRYLVDGRRWENDWEADGYVSNEYGTEDSLVKV
jgi:1,4-alpha-glucan branching enzyme